MREDRLGLPISTISDAAADAYRKGVECMLAAWPGASEQFDSAIAADPDFALAHIARGRMHQTYAQVSEARACATTARALAGRATERERRHVEILGSAIEGRGAHAIALAEEHLDETPRDAVALSLLLGAFGLYAFSGRADHDTARVAICEKVARHYGRDWWFLGYLGWSHTEAGSVGAGRALTEYSLGIRRENANAAHALAHALFEQGDGEGAERFIGDWLPLYGRDGILHGHICWHLALVALDRGDHAAALRLFEDRILPTATGAPPLTAIGDLASLVWRLELDGASGLDCQWQAATDYAEISFPRAGTMFADAHVGMLAAGPAGQSIAEDRLSAVDRLVAEGRVPAGRALSDVMRGFQAFAAKDYAAAVQHLATALPEAVRIGGSHAQREIIEDTLIVAHLRSGRPNRARTLLDARLARRPSARDLRWLADTAH